MIFMVVLRFFDSRYLCICVCMYTYIYIYIYISSLVHGYDLPRGDKEYWYALLFSF